jgi:hypothetical protein
MSEKPQKTYRKLGNEVELTRETIDNDKWAQDMLKEIGKSMSEAGFSYIGSAAVHFYSTHDNKLMAFHQGQVKHQFALGELSESFAALGAEEFLREFKRQFGHKQRTTDQHIKDKL